MILLKMITICSVISVLIACSKDVKVYQESNSRELNIISKDLIELDGYIKTVKKHQMTVNQPLDILLINQMDAPRLYNGCEVSSLAMMLDFHGYPITKNELAKQIKYVPLIDENGLKGNPHEGFVGDMVDGPGLAVYHEPIYELAAKYVGKRAINLTNRPIDSIIDYLAKGLPVWIITTTDLTPVDNFKTWQTKQGEIQITYNTHSVLVTGYDGDYFYVNDPYGFKNRKVDQADFTKTWKQMGSQAIVILYE